MIEKHYGRFMQTHAATQLALLMGAKTAHPAHQMLAVAAEKPATVAGFLPLGAKKPLQIQMVPRGFEPLLPT